MRPDSHGQCAPFAVDKVCQARVTANYSIKWKYTQVVSWAKGLWRNKNREGMMLSFNLGPDNQQSPISHTPRWPREWCPYAALFSGFCGMANCWYIAQYSRGIICAENVWCWQPHSQGPDNELWYFFQILWRQSSTGGDRHDHRPDRGYSSIHCFAALAHCWPASRRRVP